MQPGLNIWAAEEITLSKMCPLALFILMRKLPNAMFFSRCFGYNEFIALRVNFLHFRTVPHINECMQTSTLCKPPAAKYSRHKKY